MIARVLTTFTTVIALSSAALAQQPAPARETAGTTGTIPATSAPAAPAAGTPAKDTPAATPITKPPLVIAVPAPEPLAPAAPARVAAPVAVDPKDYRVGPEDILAITVWKNPELSRERVPVRPDGKISHALLNDIEVAGKTANQISAEIAQRLIASNLIENPEVSVVLLEIHSPKVSVGGNVRMAGLFELRDPNVTVLDMIYRAQGLNEFANKGNIKVIRRGQKGAIDFNYNDAVNGKNNANFIVQPGDVIVVN
jgi:polysaccharide export outer membrane protein